MKNELLIKKLLEQADEDMGAVEALKKAGYYGQALFWGHLVLEKYFKALWVFKNQSTSYPYTHNLLHLLRDCDVANKKEQIIFLAQMNQFQTAGRYGDTLKKLEHTVTQETCCSLVNEIQNQIQWVREQMEKK